MTDRVMIEICAAGREIDLTILPESSRAIGITMTVTEARSVIAALQEAVMVAAVAGMVTGAKG